MKIHVLTYYYNVLKQVQKKKMYIYLHDNNNLLCRIKLLYYVHEKNILLYMI